MSASIPDPEGFAKTIVVATISMLCVFGHESMLRRLLKKFRLLTAHPWHAETCLLPSKAAASEDRKRRLLPLPTPSCRNSSIPMWVR